jgi:kumamolisin
VTAGAPNGRPRFRRITISVPYWPVVLVSAISLVLASDLPEVPNSHGMDDITGPYASMLASSSDLGPFHRRDARLTVTLPGLNRPDSLFEGAGARGLSARWRPGNPWAIVKDAADEVARAFDVPVRD